MSFGYLVVDGFLKTEIATRALDLALKSGFIDRLLQGPAAIGDVPLKTETGRSALIGLLVANDVVSRDGSSLLITPTFRQALTFRDLIESKIAFCDSIATDVSALFPCLLDDIQQFMARSKTFQLFRYDRCFDVTDENVAATRFWMRFTTALTRYEAQAFAEVFDMSDAGTMLDIGGNSGEFALRLCQKHASLRATVFDLPVVCAIGREHIAASAEASRIRFREGDMRRSPLPGGFDLVTFKSVLHDWPEGDARGLIAKAAASVRPGGRMVIFERAPMTFDGTIPYSQLSNLVFLHFFRPPDLYVAALEQAGFARPTIETLRLEMDFQVITARKTGSSL